MFQPIRFYDDIEEKKSKFPMMEPKKHSSEEEKAKEVVKKTTTNVDNYKLDLSSMINKGSSISISVDKDISKKKSSSNNNRKRKTHEVEVNMADAGKNNSSRELNDFESNIPYAEKYEETNNLLRGTIAQLEYGLQELQQDANIIRASKTMRKKYDYLSEIHGTIGNYLGNKISAIRELNNTINKCNDFEFKRYKELKLAQGEQDDDKAIMEAYQAFVNTPVGSYGFSPLGPSSQDLTLRSPNLNAIEVQDNANGYENYIRNMTPQQHMMSLENNPDIKQVVVYDQKTGARYFEVLNMRTMEPVPNTDKMDMMLIDEFDLDLKNKVARSINMNMTMPLVVIGDATLNEY